MGSYQKNKEIIDNISGYLEDWRADRDLGYLQKHFGGSELDLDQIGKLIGKGANSRVYEYGPEHVLKIRNYTNIFDPRPRSQQLDDIRLVEEYFGPFVLPVEVIKSNVSDDFVVLQERLKSARSMKPSDINNPLIQTQFEQILQRNGFMIKNRAGSFDFFGNWSDLVSKLSKGKKKDVKLTNIMVDESAINPNLLIVDQGVFRPKINHGSPTLKETLIYNTKRLYDTFAMKNIFGYELDGRPVKGFDSLSHNPTSSYLVNRNYRLT